LSPKIELAPLRIIREEPPTAPVLFVICTPEIRPLSELTRFASGASVISPPSTVCVAYPSDFLSLVIPSAVITTSPIPTSSFS
jgi:hypothetical protein